MEGDTQLEPLTTAALIDGINSIKRIIHRLQTSRESLRKVYLNELTEARYILMSLIGGLKTSKQDIVSMLSKEEIERRMFSRKQDSVLYKSKMEVVRREWNLQQNSLAELQETFFQKNRELSLHSSYCSTQGKVLADLLCKILKYQNVVDFFLENGVELVDFAKIVNGCSYCFIRTYTFDSLLEDSVDYQYIYSLAGCIAQLASYPKSCEFLTDREECQKMLLGLISIVPLITYPPGESLIVSLLDTFSYIIKQEKGKQFFVTYESVIQTLGFCVNNERSILIYKPAWEMLEILTKNIETQEYLDRISKQVSENSLKRLDAPKFKDVHKKAKKVMSNIEKASKRLELLAKYQPQEESGECFCDQESVQGPQDRATSPISYSSMPKIKNIILKYTIRPPRTAMRGTQVGNSTKKKCKCKHGSSKSGSKTSQREKSPVECIYKSSKSKMSSSTSNLAGCSCLPCCSQMTQTASSRRNSQTFASTKVVYSPCPSKPSAQSALLLYSPLKVEIPKTREDGKRRLQNCICSPDLELPLNTRTCGPANKSLVPVLSQDRAVVPWVPYEKRLNINTVKRVKITSTVLEASRTHYIYGQKIVTRIKVNDFVLRFQQNKK